MSSSEEDEYDSAPPPPGGLSLERTGQFGPSDEDSDDDEGAPPPPGRSNKQKQDGSGTGKFDASTLPKGPGATTTSEATTTEGPGGEQQQQQQQQSSSTTTSASAAVTSSSSQIENEPSSFSTALPPPQTTGSGSGGGGLLAGSSSSGPGGVGLSGLGAGSGRESPSGSSPGGSHPTSPFPSYMDRGQSFRLYATNSMMIPAFSGMGMLESTTSEANLLESSVSGAYFGNTTSASQSQSPAATPRNPIGLIRASMSQLRNYVMTQGEDIGTHNAQPQLPDKKEIEDAIASGAGADQNTPSVPVGGIPTSEPLGLQHTNSGSGSGDYPPPPPPGGRRRSSAPSLSSNDLAHQDTLEKLPSPQKGRGERSLSIASNSNLPSPSKSVGEYSAEDYMNWSSTSAPENLITGARETTSARGPLPHQQQQQQQNSVSSSTSSSVMGSRAQTGDHSMNLPRTSTSPESGAEQEQNNQQNQQQGGPKVFRRHDSLNASVNQIPSTTSSPGLTPTSPPHQVNSFIMLGKGSNSNNLTHLNNSSSSASSRESSSLTSPHSNNHQASSLSPPNSLSNTQTNNNNNTQQQQEKQERQQQTENEIVQQQRTHSILKRGPQVGQGGFATVYIGLLTHQAIRASRLCAIKEISFDKNVAASELKDVALEFEVLRSLKHPNVIRYCFFDYSISKSLCRIVMEYVSAGSLMDIVFLGKILSDSTLRYIARQLLEGIAFIHSHGISHRDIKPANVLLHHDGTCKLADFGCSRCVNQLVESAKHVFGSPIYMAPEQIEGEIAAASDVWSLGCTLLELATGKRPWHESGLKQNIYLMFHITSEPGGPLVPDHLSHGFKSFLDACFTRGAAARPTAKELLKHPWIVGPSANFNVYGSANNSTSNFDIAATTSITSPPSSGRNPTVSSSSGAGSSDSHHFGGSGKLGGSNPLVELASGGQGSSSNSRPGSGSATPATSAAGGGKRKLSLTGRKGSMMILAEGGDVAPEKIDYGPKPLEFDEVCAFQCHWVCNSILGIPTSNITFAPPDATGLPPGGGLSRKASRIAAGGLQSFHLDGSSSASLAGSAGSARHTPTSAPLSPPTGPTAAATSSSSSMTSPSLMPNMSNYQFVPLTRGERQGSVHSSSSFSGLNHAMFAAGQNSSSVGGGIFGASQSGIQLSSSLLSGDFTSATSTVVPPINTSSSSTTAAQMAQLAQQIASVEGSGAAANLVPPNVSSLGGTTGSTGSGRGGYPGESSGSENITPTSGISGGGGGGGGAERRASNSSNYAGIENVASFNADSRRPSDLARVRDEMLGQMTNLPPSSSSSSFYAAAGGGGGSAAGSRRESMRRPSGGLSSVQAFQSFRFGANNSSSSGSGGGGQMFMAASSSSSSFSGSGALLGPRGSMQQMQQDGSSDPVDGMDQQQQLVVEIDDEYSDLIPVAENASSAGLTEQQQQQQEQHQQQRAGEGSTILETTSSHSNSSRNSPITSPSHGASRSPPPFAISASVSTFEVPRHAQGSGGGDAMMNQAGAVAGGYRVSKSKSVVSLFGDYVESPERDRNEASLTESPSGHGQTNSGRGERSPGVISPDRQSNRKNSGSGSGSGKASFTDAILKQQQAEQQQRTGENSPASSLLLLRPAASMRCGNKPIRVAVPVMPGEKPVMLELQAEDLIETTYSNSPLLSVGGGDNNNNNENSGNNFAAALSSSSGSAGSGAGTLANNNSLGEPESPFSGFSGHNSPATQELDNRPTMAMSRSHSISAGGGGFGQRKKSFAIAMTENVKTQLQNAMMERRQRKKQEDEENEASDYADDENVTEGESSGDEQNQTGTPKSSKRKSTKRQSVASSSSSGVIVGGSGHKRRGTLTGPNYGVTVATSAGEESGGEDSKRRNSGSRQQLGGGFLSTSASEWGNKVDSSNTSEANDASFLSSRNASGDFTSLTSSSNNTPSSTVNRYSHKNVQSSVPSSGRGGGGGGRSTSAGSFGDDEREGNDHDHHSATSVFTQDLIGQRKNSETSTAATTTTTTTTLTNSSVKNPPHRPNSPSSSSSNTSTPRPSSGINNKNNSHSSSNSNIEQISSTSSFDESSSSSASGPGLLGPQHKRKSQKALTRVASPNELQL